MNGGSRNAAKTAFRFVLVVGIVNLFADFTYEGARSVIGPFLASLGASATVVGFVAGLGEMAGYGLRSVSGYFADKTRKYWVAAFCGYAINMLAVPALALAGNWPLAATFIVAERTGRAIRRPAMESMLSEAGSSIGHGWVFGFNEALDQAGATIGPLVTAFILYRRANYHRAFAVLLIPAVLCLAVLVIAFVFHQRAGHPEERKSVVQGGHFKRAYWFYVAAGALVAAGFADFSLISFHFQKTETVRPEMIPVYYAIAMATGAVAALLLGKLLDKAGLLAIFAGFGVSAFFAPLVFLGPSSWELAGMVLWGIGMGAQDSCLKALLSPIVAAGRRGTAFGVFDGIFGVAWFAGSATMGLLYRTSLPALVIFSVVLQLLALPVFTLAHRQTR